MKYGKDYVVKMLPHRDPMLLVDSVEELISGEKIQTKFFVDPNRDIFKGHFPKDPVLPGVYTVECMGQTSSILAADMERYQNKIPLFYGIDNVRLLKKIFPESTLLVTSALKKEVKERGILSFDAIVECSGELAATGTVTIAMR